MHTGDHSIGIGCILILQNIFVGMGKKMSPAIVQQKRLEVVTGRVAVSEPNVESAE